MDASMCRLPRKSYVQWVQTLILSLAVGTLLDTLTIAAGQSISSSCGMPLPPLPPMGTIISEALTILPQSLTNYSALKKRMQQSVWVPIFGLSFGNDTSSNNDKVNGTTRATINLTWNFPQYLFHSQETDAIALFQRTKENEISLRNQIAIDYANITNAKDQYMERSGRVVRYAEAMRSAAKIDALTSD